jgi:hypothetical protein
LKKTALMDSMVEGWAWWPNSVAEVLAGVCATPVPP